jgi:hypothetical protein
MRSTVALTVNLIPASGASSERAAKVEIGERETPKAVNINTPIALIQAHKFGGV